jgi:hypothetical protein
MSVVHAVGGILYNNSFAQWATTNATVPTYESYQFVNGSITNLHRLIGTQYLISQAFSNSATLNINLWFYPTVNNVVIMSELGQDAEETGWHYSMLEITNDSHLKGRVWEMTDGVTSTGTVNLNAWNHVYLYYDSGTRTIGMRLNNETAVTQTLSVGVRHVSDTNSTFFAIGTTETNVVQHSSMGSTARYQGRFDDLSIDTTITGSTYNTFAVAVKYRAVPVMSLFADSYSGTGIAWPDSSGQNHGTTLVNAPTFHNTVPKYFTFNRSSLQYVQGSTIADLSRWTIESWFRISEPLSNTAIAAIITTTYDDPATSAHPGQINYTMSSYRGNSLNSPYLTVGFYNGTWHTTDGFIPEVGRWYHVVGAYNGSSLTQWVDGEIQSGINLTEYTSANGGAVRVARRWDGYSTNPNAGNYDASENYFPGDIAVAKIYSGAVLNSDVQAFYNATKNNYPNQLSMTFYNAGLTVPASSDWNLGSTYTIEFWMKANHGSADGINISGGQWGLFNQGGNYGSMPNNNSIMISLSSGNLSIGQSNTSDVQYAEPDIGGGVTGVFNVSSEGGWNGAHNYPTDWTNLATTGGTGKGLTVSIAGVGGGYVNAIAIVNPGHGYTSGDTITTVGGESVAYFVISTVTPRKWTHVALVNNAGDQKVYYNGVEQTITSGTHLANGWTNTTSDLYIGRLASPPSYFDGKLALVRISNSARYTAPFTPTTTYGTDSNTKLFLGLTTPLVDTSSSAHTVTNSGVTETIDAPVAPGIVKTNLLFELDINNFNGGTTWDDLSVNSNDFTFISTPTLVHAGTDIGYWDNSQGTTYAQSLASILPSGSYTKGAFIYTAGAGWGVGNIISGGGSNDDAWYFASSPYLNAGHNGQWSTVVSTAIPSDEWVYVCVTFDTSAGWKLYLNGNVVGTNSDTTPFTQAQASTQQIGAYNNSYNYAGRIAAAHEYTRALTQSEIQHNYDYYHARYA